MGQSDQEKTGEGTNRSQFYLAASEDDNRQASRPLRPATSLLWGVFN